MGTDINGAFAHHIAFPPSVSLAEDMCAGIKKLSPLIQNLWRLDPERTYPAAPLSRIHDPQGLSVWFGPRAAIISTGFGWDQASEDSDLKHMVTTAICAVAQFFQSPSVVYLPDDIEPWCYADDWIADGCTLEELQQRLACIREPSPNFSEAIRAGPDSFKVDGYVIEMLKYNAI